MNIAESSLLLKFISKIDLSNQDQVINTVRQSGFFKVLNMPVNMIGGLVTGFSGSSLFIKYLDHIILANLLMLILAVTFCPSGILGLLVTSAFGLTAVKWFLGKDQGHNFTLFDIPISVYIAVAVISVAFSSYLMPSAKGLAKLLVYFASYIVFTNIFKGKVYKIYLILIAIAVTGGIESLLGIYQKVAGIEALATWQDPDSIMAGRKMSRVYGSLLPLNPNLLGGYLLPVMPVALGVGLIVWLKKGFIWSVPFFGFACSTLLCLVFTGSRGAYIGVALMCAVIYLFAGHLIWHEFKENKYHKLMFGGWLLAGIIAVSAVLVALLFVPALNDRVMSIFTLRGNSSNSFRMNVYLSSFEMFKDNWLIGIGPGNTTFRLVYGFYMVTGFDALGAYSVPLEIAVEMGIVGLVAFLWLLLIVFSNAIKVFNSTKYIEIKIIIATIISALCGLAGQGLFDTIWYRPQVQIIFWALIAILSCIVSRKVSLSSNEENR